MELGNLLFGNSRGNYPVDRSFGDNKQWIRLTRELIQVYDYHCNIDDRHYCDYHDYLNIKERTSKMKPNEYGGVVCEYNGEIIFEIFPYYWGDCTCGANDHIDDEPHKEDCLLVKHNFIYHPNQEDEYWIDWYKYPFRDSYSNRKITNDEFSVILEDCCKYAELLNK